MTEIKIEVMKCCYRQVPKGPPCGQPSAFKVFLPAPRVQLVGGVCVEHRDALAHVLSALTADPPHYYEEFLKAMEPIQEGSNGGD